jgi:hypothetical protein
MTHKLGGKVELLAVLGQQLLEEGAEEKGKQGGRCDRRRKDDEMSKTDNETSRV